MALFATDPVKAAIKYRDEQASRLKDDEAKAAVCGVAVDKLTRDLADDSRLDDALAKARDAEGKVTSRRKALADASARIADLGAQAAAAADKRQRAETAQAIEQIAIRLQQAGATFEQAAAGLAAASREAAAVVLDAGPLVGYAQSAGVEVKPAVDMVATVLRHRAVLTINGSAPAALLLPEQPVAPRPQRAALPPTTMRLFLTQPLSWYDENGERHRAAAMNDAELPLPLVAKARAIGAAHDMTSQERKQLHGSKTSAPPEWHHCRWLNENPKAPTKVAPIQRSMFEPLPGVARPYTMTIPVQPVEPMAATRSMDDES